MNYCAIDPGAETGVGIFDPRGVKIHSGVLKDRGDIMAYYDALAKVRDRWEIQVALIEGYFNMGKRFASASKVESQIRVCKDVFPCHLLVHTAQWNPRGLSNKMKKAFAMGIYSHDFPNGHVVDAVLMGKWLFDRLQVSVVDPYGFMVEVGNTKKRFPVRQELAEMATRKYVAMQDRRELWQVITGATQEVSK